MTDLYRPWLTAALFGAAMLVAIRAHAEVVTERGADCTRPRLDASREYAYGPAHGLPSAKVGTFTQSLCAEAKIDGWIVISMKDDWRRIFAFEP